MVGKTQLDPEKADPGHSQQLKAMSKAADIRAAVLACKVSYRNIDYAETHNRGREEQLKIADRIEIAEIAAPRDKAAIVVAG